MVGRVVDEEGRPVAGADVQAHLVRYVAPPRVGYEWIRNWQAATDAEGRYELTGMRHPESGGDEIHLDIVAPGLVDAWKSPSLGALSASGSARLALPEVKLGRGTRLRGRCLGADSRPVAGARVYVLSERVSGGGDPRGEYWHARPRSTDVEGRFEVVVPSGTRAELIAYADSWAPQRVVVSSGEKDSQLADIVLTRGTRVSGVLSSHDGQALAGYWVLAQSTDAGGFARAANKMLLLRKTDKRGAFELPPLKGEFEVSVCSHLAPWPTEEFVYSPGPMPAIVAQVLTFDGSVDRVELPLRVVPQVRVRGRVLGFDQKPLPGVQVGLDVQKGSRTVNLRVAATDAEGRFVFEGIPKGIEDVWLGTSLVLVGGKAVKPRPLPEVKGARPDGRVHWDRLDEDMDGVDFAVAPPEAPGAAPAVAAKPPVEAAGSASAPSAGIDPWATGTLIVLVSVAALLAYRTLRARPRSRPDPGT